MCEQLQHKLGILTFALLINIIFTKSLFITKKIDLKYIYQTYFRVTI